MSECSEDPTSAFVFAPDATISLAADCAVTDENGNRIGTVTGWGESSKGHRTVEMQLDDGTPLIARFPR